MYIIEKKTIHGFQSVLSRNKLTFSFQFSQNVLRTLVYGCFMPFKSLDQLGQFLFASLSFIS